MSYEDIKSKIRGKWDDEEEIEFEELSDDDLLIQQNVDRELRNIKEQEKLLEDIKEKERYNKTFAFFINKIKERLRDDWDLVIAVSGTEGVGKSSLGIEMCKAIDKNFLLDKNVSYLPDAKEIFDKLNSINQYGAYLIDEAVRVLHKHHWFDNVQQKINEWYATERYQNKVTILCIPRFTNLTENFRNHRVNIWVHVLARGIAIVYLKDLDKDTDDPWHIKFNRQLKEKLYKNKRVAEISIQAYLYAERKTKNYLFDFTFPDLAPEEKNLYLELKVKSRDKLKAEAQELDEQEKRFNRG